MVETRTVNFLNAIQKSLSLTKKEGVNALFSTIFYWILFVKSVNLVVGIY
jgi:hypothetical protein